MHFLHCCTAILTLPTLRPAGVVCNSDVFWFSLIHKGNSVFFKELAHKMQSWRRYRAAVRELSLLSDRELRDLGLNRQDICNVARQSAGML